MAGYIVGKWLVISWGSWWVYTRRVGRKDNMRLGGYIVGKWLGI